MLLQRRAKALRLIRQHDHALVSGQMAAAWIGPAGDEFLPLEVILATALHDAPWREADRHPRLDPDSGLPHDFVTYPREQKYAFLARGLDELARIHPFVAILVSLHHESFLREGELPEWREQEAARRGRLSREAGVDLRDAEPALALLQLFDNLSLFLCLAAPGCEPDTAPGWLDHDRLYAVPGPGVILERRWLDGDTLALRPFPFRGPVEPTIPYREARPGPFENQEELDRGLERGRTGVWRPRLIRG